MSRADEGLRGQLADQVAPAFEPADWMEGSHGADLVVQMAHDLRSPLTAIVAMVESLQQGLAGPLTDAQRRQLGMIYAAAH
jgi:signal transduction histidine kinase